MAHAHADLYASGAIKVAPMRGGRPLPVIDGLLLATAAVHERTFVTRNDWR